MIFHGSNAALIFSPNNVIYHLSLPSGNTFDVRQLCIETNASIVEFSLMYDDLSEFVKQVCDLQRYINLVAEMILISIKSYEY